jgi:hypothetical protein
MRMTARADSWSLKKGSKNLQKLAKTCQKEAFFKSSVFPGFPQI